MDETCMTGGMGKALRNGRGIDKWNLDKISGELSPCRSGVPSKLDAVLEYLDKINGYTAEAENEDGVGKLFDFARAVFKTKRKGKERKGEDKGD